MHINLASQSLLQGIKISPYIITLLDFSLLAIVITSFVDGLRGGIFSFILNLIAFFVAIVAAKVFYAPIRIAVIRLFGMEKMNLPNNISSVHLAGIIAFILVFSLAYGLTRGIAYMVSSGSRTIKYSIGNKIAGGLMNLLVTSIILAIAVALLKQYAAPIYSQIASRSYMFRYLAVYKGIANVIITKGYSIIRSFYASA